MKAGRVSRGIAAAVGAIALTAGGVVGMSPAHGVVPVDPAPVGSSTWGAPDCGGTPTHRTGYMQPWGGCFQWDVINGSAWVMNEMQTTQACYVPDPPNAVDESGCAKWDVTKPGGNAGPNDPVGEVLATFDGNGDSKYVGIYWKTTDGPLLKGICADFNWGFPEPGIHLCDLPNIPEGTHIMTKMGRCPVGPLNECNLQTSWNWGNPAVTKTFYDDTNVTD